MSYILDALKKADQERRRGKNPDFLDPHGRPPQEPKKRTWLYVPLIIFVAAAGSLGWYFGHDNADMNEVRLKPAPVQIVTEKHAVQQPETQPALAHQLQKPSAEQPAAEPLKQTPPKAEIVTDTKIPLKPSKPLKSLKEKPVASAKAEESVAAPEPKANPKKIYSINELPDSVKQGLPAFNITTHIYSPEPSERLASINGHIGREGKELMPGVVLDSVLPDGAILKYQGYRFRVALR
jgi:general secretion pathway protein B